MRFLLLASILTSILFSGCHTDPRGRRESALLRAEILDLEDQYYLMKSKYESTLRQLRECRGEPIGFDGSIDCEDCPPGQTMEPGRLIPERSDDLNGEEPIINIEIPEVDSTPQLELPAPNNDSSSQPGEIIPRPDSGTRFDASQMRLESGLEGQLEDSYGPPAASVDILKQGTYGHDVDGQPGDEGLVLLVQPKDRHGRAISRPAELTVSIIDPKAEAARQRIGLWKFEAGETELFLVNQPASQRGILLHLPWDQNVPRRKTLVVFVRYTTDDGRRLETSLPVSIQPPPANYSADDPVVTAWTQNSKRWDSIGTPNSGSGAERIITSPSTSRGPVINRPRWQPVR